MKYRREIDGLRALAVIPVILFHAGFGLFSGGFVGVDVFFVISGYLITSLILADKQAGTFSLVNFYERRARRILPALFFVMAVCVPVAWLWLLPADMKSFSQSLVAVSGFASNVLFWQTTDYFETASELKPLLHTWSLAVEEQYYLFYPILLLLVWRLGRAWMLAILATAAVIGLAIAQRGSVVAPVATYYLLPTRGWELLIGALVALYFSNNASSTPGRAANEMGSVTGLALLIYSVFAFDERTPFPSLYALVPTIGTALVILCATHETLVGKLLGHKLFVGIGLISYSAYLWHQPLLAFARQRSLGAPNPLLLAGLAIAAVVLAYFSWKYVEMPFRSRHRFTRKQIFVYGVTASAAFIAFGLVGHISKGYPHRMPPGVELPDMELAKIDNGWCFYSIDSIRNLKFGANGLDCWLGDKSARTRGVLFGDSYAAQYEPLWDRAGLEAKVAINAITTNWCYPSSNEQFTGPLSSRALEQCLYNRKYLAENISKFDFAILSASWGEILSQGKMEGVLQLIRDLSPRMKLVILMASPKQFDLDVMALYQKSVLHKDRFDIASVPARRDQRSADAHALLEKTSKKYANVLFVDRDSIFHVNGGRSDLTSENIPFSLDGEHISVYGAKAAVATFLSSEKYAEIKRVLGP